MIAAYLLLFLAVVHVVNGAANDAMERVVSQLSKPLNVRADPPYQELVERARDQAEEAIDDSKLGPFLYEENMSEFQRDSAKKTLLGIRTPTGAFSYLGESWRKQNDFDMARWQKFTLCRLKKCWVKRVGSDCLRCLNKLKEKSSGAQARSNFLFQYCAPDDHPDIEPCRRERAIKRESIRVERQILDKGKSIRWSAELKPAAGENPEKEAQRDKIVDMIVNPARFTSKVMPTCAEYQDCVASNCFSALVENGDIGPSCGKCRPSMCED